MRCCAPDLNTDTKQKPILIPKYENKHITNILNGSNSAFVVVWIMVYIYIY